MPKATYAYGLSDVVRYEEEPNVVLKNKIITIPFTLLKRTDLAVKVDGVQTNEYVFNTSSSIELKKVFNKN